MYNKYKYAYEYKHFLLSIYKKLCITKVEMDNGNGVKDPKDHTLN